MLVLPLYIYQDSPELLIFTLIGYTHHKYASVYTYYLSQGRILKGHGVIKCLAVSFSIFIFQIVDPPDK